MLKIRLQRKGKKKQAFFRVVLQEHTEKLRGEYLELLGTYDPHAKKLDVDVERIQHWMSKGAQVSPTLNNLMVNHKLWDREKMQSWKPKPKEQAEEAAPAAAETPADKTAEAPDQEEEKPAEEGEQDQAQTSTEKPTDEAPKEEAAPATA